MEIPWVSQGTSNNICAPFMDQPPKHIPLCRRKGLAMRMLVAATIEGMVCDNEEDYRRYNQLLQELFVIAARCRELKGQRLDHFFHLSAEDINDHWRGSVHPPFPIKLKRRLSQLHQILQNFNCESCNLKRAVCKGDTYDSTIFSVNGFCLTQLKQVFYFVVKQAQLLQKSICGEVFLPEFRLATEIIDARSKTLPSDINISGAYDVDTNEITLTFREDALTRSTLVQIIYVIAHEILCHGLQGLYAQARENSDEYCSWTEGFMDRLAFFHIDDWIRSHRSLPGWLTQSKGFSTKACLRLHSQRTEESSLAGYAKELRDNAINVCDNLREAFTGRHAGDTTRLKSFFYFCHLMNFHDISPTNRQKILVAIGELLDNSKNNMTGSMSPDHHDIVSVCHNFIRYRDISQFVREIERIAGCSLGMTP